MARKREFDREVALDGAMRLFWRKGYGACNIAELVEETGVARYGWYIAFGDKDEVYVAALERYREYLNRQHLDKLRAPGADLKAIEAHFRLNLGRGPLGRSKGCFACAAAAQRADEDKRVARVVAATFADVRSAFQSATENAVHAGQLRDLPIDTLVEFSTGAMHHLSTLLRSGARRKEIEAYIDCSLAMIAP